MRFGPNEYSIADPYYFKGTNDVGNMSVLTNKRLVVVYGNAEESYALSKISAVRIIFDRSLKMIVCGVLLALIGLASFVKVPALGVLSLALGGLLVYLGWKGKTHLFISSIGGNKLYAVRGQDPALREFMDSVNFTLA